MGSKVVLFTKGLWVAAFTLMINPAFAQPDKTVIELFTSEGCSSCPAAEKTLAQLQEKYGAGLLILEYHVDYWNYLGWKDAYSDPLFTQRQQDYVHAFRLESAYTPQAVVNGRVEMVGSDKQLLEAEIAKGQKVPVNKKLDLAVETKGSSISVTSHYKPGGNEILTYELVQKRAVTDVKRGENNGRKLEHIHVVRALRSIEPGSGVQEVKFDIPQGVTADNWGIAVILQDPKTMAVLGSGSFGLVD